MASAWPINITKYRSRCSTASGSLSRLALQGDCPLPKQPISELAGYAPDSEEHGERGAKQRTPGSIQQFPLRNAPACTENIGFAKEAQAVASKTKLVTWQQLPLNDSAGGQNATPANEKAPGC